MNHDDTTESDRLFNEGGRYQDSRDYGRAEKSYRDALACVAASDGRRIAEIALKLANLYSRQSVFDKAAEYYGKILDIDPQNPEIHRNRGRCYRQMGEYAQAEKAFADALACMGKIEDKQLRDRVAMEVELELGDICVERGDHAQAADHYGMILSIDPAKPEIHRNRGRCYRRTGDDIRAEQAYQDALACIGKIDSVRLQRQAIAEIELELGDICAARGDYAQAADHYGRILAVSPARPEIYRNQGRCYRQMARDDKAAEAYEAALACIGNIADKRQQEQITAEIELELGDICAARGDYAQAADHYGRILAVGPVRPEIHRNRGRCYRQMGEDTRAEQAYQEALACVECTGDQRQKAQVLEEIYDGLAELSGRKADYVKALEYYGKIRDIDPAKPENYLNIGRCRQKLGEYGPAEAAYLEALACAERNGDTGRRQSTVAAALFELAEVCRARSEFGKAAGYYEKARDIDGKNPEIYLNLGRCHGKRGDSAAAAAAYAEALALLEGGEQSVSSCLHAAAVHKELGDYARALECLTRAEAMDPGNTDVGRAFGEVYVMQHEYAAAVRIFENVLEKTPGATSLYGSLGYAYKGIGDSTKALAYFCRARERYRNDPDLVRNMGEIYLRQGDYDTGIALLQEYLSDGTGDDEARGGMCLLLARLHFRRGERAAAAGLLRGYLGTLGAGKVFLVNKLLNIAEYLEGRTVMESMPTAITITITSRCNLRCLMCGTPEKTFDVPEKTLGEIRELFPYLEHVTWLGGEVFMSKYFNDLFDASLAYANIFSQEVVTNGLLLTEAVIEKYIKHKVTLTLSVDGLTAPTYEGIRRGGRFGDLVRNLELIAGYRARCGQTRNGKLRMNFVVMRRNYREVGQLPDFCARYGFNCVNVIRLIPHPGLEDENIENDLSALEFLRIAMAQVVAKMEALGIEIRLDRFFGNMDMAGCPVQPEVAPAQPGGDAGPVPPEDGDAPAAVPGRQEPAAAASDQECAEPHGPVPGAKAPQGGTEAGEPEAVWQTWDENDPLNIETYLYDAHVSHCRAPWQRMTLQADGKAYPDCDCLTAAGDFTMQSLREIWNGEMMQRYRAALRDKTGLDICNRQCRMKKNLCRDAGTISF
jgi:tetratricopeptide (TPR) repeat protein